MLRTIPPDFHADFRSELHLGELIRRVEEALAAIFEPPIRLQSAWPVSLRPETCAARGPGVAVHLAISPSPSAARLVIWLDAALAIYVVERTLGGSGHGAAAHHTLNLRAAEQGVLAYVAARVSRAFDGLCVTDVAPDFPSGQSGVLVPLGVEVGKLRATACCVWLDGVGENAPAQFQAGLRLELLEDMEDAELAALAHGDLVRFEHAALHCRDGQLWGSALASFQGGGHTVLSTLEGRGIVRRFAPSPGRAPARMRIELVHQRVSFEQLARFGSGERIELEALPAEVRILKDGEPFARGELVLYRGRIAVRIAAAP